MLRKSQPAPVSSVMPGDFIRIAVSNGSQLNMLGAISSPVTTGAFGRAAMENGKLVLQMHELMPNDIRAMQTINLSPSAMVERVSFDNDNELAILGVQYLREMGEIVRSRASSGSADQMKAMLTAVLQSSARPLMDKLAQSGLSVVEKSVTRSEVVKKVYITSNPEALTNGEVPEDVVAFDIAPQSVENMETNVFPADRISEVLYAPVRVINGAATPATAAPAGPELNPFMRGLLGMPVDADETINPEDFGIDDDSNDRFGQ